MKRILETLKPLTGKGMHLRVRAENLSKKEYGEVLEELSAPEWQLNTDFPGLALEAVMIDKPDKIKKVITDLKKKGWSTEDSKRFISECFISAPANADTTILRNILLEKGIKTYDLYDLSVGKSIQNVLKRKIKEADFCVIVISENNPNVYYELGICDGLGKPIFIIVDKDSNVPFFIQNHMYFKTSLDDSESLKIPISNFIDAIIPKKYLKNKHKKSIFHSLDADSIEYYKKRITEIRQNGTEFELEKIIEEIFNKLNLQVVKKENFLKDKGVDFALWDDSLSSLIGNPIFIEVKSGQLNYQKIKQSEEQLQNYINETDAKAGILLYLDKNDKRFTDNFSYNPLILRFDFEDFLSQLSLNYFENAILDLRNKIVHGNL